MTKELVIVLVVVVVGALASLLVENEWAAFGIICITVAVAAALTLAIGTA